MASPERLYRGSVRVLSAVILLIGIALLVRTTTAGGGVLGYVLGVAFVGVGAGRIYIDSRIGE